MDPERRIFCGVEVGLAAWKGVGLTAIARDLSISTASGRATREREVAPSPPSPGVEPDLDPGNDLRWDDAEGTYVEVTITITALRAQLAGTYGIDDATFDDLVEDVFDPRVLEITVAEAAGITHAAWEAVRDPACGRAELRHLRAWRFHNGLDRTSPREMIVAAAEAGAYVADVASAAATAPEAVYEAVADNTADNAATTSTNTPATSADDAAARARAGVLRKLSDGESHTAGSVRVVLRHGPVRDRFDVVVADLLAEGVLVSETTTRSGREVTLLRLADPTRGGE